MADTIRVDIAGRAQPIEINRYIVSKGDEHAVVLYWYQSRDRVVASEYRAAAFTAWDALRYNRTDTELVRVVDARDARRRGVHPEHSSRNCAATIKMSEYLRCHRRRRGTGGRHRGQDPGRSRRLDAAARQERFSARQALRRRNQRAGFGAISVSQGRARRTSPPVG